MAQHHQVVFYPVGNGDTAQIILDNGRRVLLDFRHATKSEDESTPEIDLKGRLRGELDEAKRNNFDVVAFTHADQDHIQGSTEFFELQHAAKYQGDGRVKIDQLWVPAAMVLESAENDKQSEEFVILRQEARHRLLEGRDILVFSKPQALMDWLIPKLKDRGESATSRDHLFVDAGQLVPGFDLSEDSVEFFCHSPFVKHCEDGDIIRNSASLMFNVRFKADAEVFNFLAVGDAEWCDIEDIVSTTRAHGNEDRLTWDLYNIPHHCSYLALSDEKGDNETTPKPLVKDLLECGTSGSYIVCSCKPIPDIDDSYKSVQPPHIQARKAYKRSLDSVGGMSVLVTMEEPNANKPEPLVFDIKSDGLTWKKKTIVGAAAIVTSKPSRAG